MQFTPEKLILNISNTPAVRISLLQDSLLLYKQSPDTSNWQSHLHSCGDNQSRTPCVLCALYFIIRSPYLPSIEAVLLGSMLITALSMTECQKLISGKLILEKATSSILQTLPLINKYVVLTVTQFTNLQFLQCYIIIWFVLMSFE